MEGNNEGEGMKCPLKCIGDYSLELMMDNPAFECLKEDCAWWQVGDEQCSVLNLTEGIADIAHWLGDIKNNMPHEGQFKR